MGRPGGTPKNAVNETKPIRSNPIWRWRWPLAALVVATPILIYAVACSLAWIGTTFPGFFLMNNGVVPTVSGFDWPPDRNAIFHAEVVEVDFAKVDSSIEVYRRVAAMPAATTFEYRFRRGEEQFSATLASREFGWPDFLQTYGILLVFGAAWLIFGITVGFLQPERSSARVFLCQSLVAGLYPVAGIFLYQGDLEWLTRLYFLLECLFPATWLHLAVVFPIEQTARKWKLAVPAVTYSFSIVLAALVIRGLGSEPVVLAPLHATYIFSGVCMLAFACHLAVQFVRHHDSSTRARIKAVLPGAFAAAAVASFAITNSALATRDFPVQFGLIFTPLFSIGVAVAIAKHDLFDVDRYVRTSIVYLIVSVLVVSAYAAIVSLTPELAPGEGYRPLRLGLFLILAFALNPVRLLIQRLIDRAFYRSRLSYRTTLEDLSEAMTSMLDTKEIVSEVTGVVADSMQLESATFALAQSSERPAEIWVRRAGQNLSELRSPDAVRELADALGADAQPHHAAAISERSPQTPRSTPLPDLLEALQIELIVPLTFRGDNLGALLLGSRRSGRGFDSEDWSLLRTLANQTAVAVHNARSYESLENLTRDLDRKVREQTEALRDSNRDLREAYDQLKDAQSQLLQSEKLASLGRLVAGVAHELNNPASFVHGGLENLQRYVTRLTKMIEAYESRDRNGPGETADIARMREDLGLEYLLRETPTLLKICIEGSDRIKKIIDDLRIFARSDRGERRPVDIGAGIRQTLELLQNKIDRGQVTLRIDLSSGPTVDADPGQLNQVWMNLISNALDAVDGIDRPTLEVAVRSVHEGHPDQTSSVEAVISDNGSGIAPEHIPHIFEPFFTTKPVGAGTGLGLAIAYGAVRSHGGTIRVRSTPGRGTSFVVQLPGSPAAPASG